MKGSRRLVLAGLLAVALVLGTVFLWPVAPEPRVEPNETNDRVYVQLANAGFPDAVVDVSPDRALVRLNVPSGVDRDDAIRDALAVTATGAPASERIVLQLYEDHEPAVQVSVDTEVVLAYVRSDSASESELEQELTVVPATG